MFESSEFENFFDLPDEEFLPNAFVISNINDQSQKKAQVGSVIKSPPSVENPGRQSSSPQLRLQNDVHTSFRRPGVRELSSQFSLTGITLKKEYNDLNSSQDENRPSSPHKQRHLEDDSGCPVKKEKQSEQYDVNMSECPTNADELSSCKGLSKPHHDKHAESVSSTSCFDVWLDDDFMFDDSGEHGDQEQDHSDIPAKKRKFEHDNDINKTSSSLLPKVTLKSKDKEVENKHLSDENQDIGDFNSNFMKTRDVVKCKTRMTAIHSDLTDHDQNTYVSSPQVTRPGFCPEGNTVCLDRMHTPIITCPDSSLSESSSKALLPSLPRRHPFVSTENSTVCIESNIKCSKRRFPGPAGLLPHIPLGSPNLMSKLLTSPTSALPEKLGIPNEIPSSQSSEQDFFKGPWLQMMKDYNSGVNNSESLIDQINISWTVKKFKAKQLPRGKVPVLFLLVKSVNVKRKEGTGIFRDKTGEITGCIHRKLMEEFSKVLCPGTAIVLKQVGLLSFPPKKYYLNLTEDNIVCMYYYNEESEEVDRIAINECTRIDLEIIAKQAMIEMNRLQGLPSSSSLVQPHISTIKSRASKSSLFTCEGLQNSLIHPSQPGINYKSGSFKVSDAEVNRFTSLFTSQNLENKLVCSSTTTATQQKNVENETTHEESVCKMDINSEVAIETKLHSQHCSPTAQLAESDDYKWEEDGFEELLKSMESMDDNDIFGI